LARTRSDLAADWCTPCVCAALLVGLLAGCAAPVRRFVIAPPPPDDLMARIAELHAGLDDGWAWAYSVMPEQPCKLPRAVDRDLLASDLRRVNELMGDTTVTAVGVPAPEELLLLADDGAADRRIWLDPYHVYARDADGSEVHLFVRYQTTRRGALLRREMVQRIGKQDGVRELTVRNDLPAEETTFATRELPGTTVHALPEGTFTPWRFGLTFGPPTDDPKPLREALRAWRLEVANPGHARSTEAGEASPEIRLLARRPSEDGADIWEGALTLTRGGSSNAPVLPARLTWRTSRRSGEEVYVEAWLSDPDGESRPLIPSRVRRTIADPMPSSLPRTLVYALGSFHPIGDAPIRIKELESVYKDVEAMTALGALTPPDGPEPVDPVSPSRAE